VRVEYESVESGVKVNPIREFIYLDRLAHEVCLSSRLWVTETLYHDFRHNHGDLSTSDKRY